MIFNRPLALHFVVRDDVGRELSRLGGLEGFARAVTATVLPLAVLDSLGSTQAVSNVYFVGALAALTVTLNTGRLERLFTRRWLLTLSLLGSIGAALIACISNSYAVVVAVALVNIEASTFTVLLAMFIMDYIGRRELAGNESRRLVYSGLGWLLGPITAYLLYGSVAPAAPFLVGMFATTVALTYFWILRLGPNPALATPISNAPSPFRSIPRYFAQRYLRIAYIICLARGIFWTSFFVYVPVYSIEAGLPRAAVGPLVSAVAVLLLAGPVVRRFAVRFTNRALMVAGFAIVGAACLGLFSLESPQPIGIVFWVIGCSGAVILDVVGNLPFMRTVKPRERLAMTSVFSSARDASSLLAPGLGALVLWLGPFHYYFVVLAAISFAVAGLATGLPRRI